MHRQWPGHVQRRGPDPEPRRGSPGVQVTADAETPVFYSDNYYWRNDNGVWLRSNRHDSGFARVDVVPDRIRTIDRPSMYVHYHGRVTDHEARKDISEERKDSKEWRKEAKEERKEERHERHND